MNVLQTNESKIKPSYQHQLLLGEQVWNRFGQSANQHYKLTIGHCNFCRQKDHFLIDCLFIEQDVQDAMTNHFHIQTQNH